MTHEYTARRGSVFFGAENARQRWYVAGCPVFAVSTAETLWCLRPQLNINNHKPFVVNRQRRLSMQATAVEE